MSQLLIEIEKTTTLTEVIRTLLDGDHNQAAASLIPRLSETVVALKKEVVDTVSELRTLRASMDTLQEVNLGLHEQNEELRKQVQPQTPEASPC